MGKRIKNTDLKVLNVFFLVKKTQFCQPCIRAPILRLTPGFVAVFPTFHQSARNHVANVDCETGSFIGGNFDERRLRILTLAIHASGYCGRLPEVGRLWFEENMLAHLETNRDRPKLVP